ncbi:hypothetical protein AYO48_04595 [Gaiella sp. SCGC AG-212-M14]|nr:hypothetical protein AYO48_04595 [Gaiella sp. SCGC AG-212-M14]
MTNGQQERALGVTGTHELTGHRVERLGESAQLAGAGERQRLRLVTICQPTAGAGDAQHRTGDASRKHGGHRSREQAADRGCGRECHPERPALGAH